MPMMEMFDRGIQLRMGQAHVKRWIPDLMPMVADSGDSLGVRTFVPHHLPLDQARHGCEMFRDKADGCIKVVLQSCPAPLLTRHEAPGGSGHGVPSRRERPLSSASVSCGTQGSPVGGLQADAPQALSVRVTAGVGRQAKRTGSTPQCTRQDGSSGSPSCAGTTRPTVSIKPRLSLTPDPSPAARGRGPELIIVTRRELVLPPVGEPGKHQGGRASYCRTSRHRTVRSTDGLQVSGPGLRLSVPGGRGGWYGKGDISDGQPSRQIRRAVSSWRHADPLEVSADPADVESVTIRYLMYVLLPAWLVPGMAGYVMHRYQDRTDQRPGESAIHALMMAEISVRLMLTVLCEVNPPLPGISTAAAGVHEATAIWDVRPRSTAGGRCAQPSSTLTASSNRCRSWQRRRCCACTGTRSPVPGRAGPDPRRGGSGCAANACRPATWAACRPESPA